MRIIKYLFLSCEVPHNSGVEQIFLEKSVSYSEASEELAREEAYNGEYSIVEDELEQGPATGIKLLWKNDNPTSEFAAQTIPLILTDYDFVDVYFSKASNDPTNWICHRLHIGYDGDPFHMSHIQNTSKASVISSRHTSVTTAGVEFGGGFYKYTSSNTGGAENESMIPCRIYGIKGVVGQPIVPEDAPETGEPVNVDLLDIAEVKDSQSTPLGDGRYFVAYAFHATAEMRFLEVGKEYTVTINGNSYTDIAVDGSFISPGTVCIGDVEAAQREDIANIRYMIAYGPIYLNGEPTGAFQIAVYYVGTESELTECTISIEETQLDEKYIPDTMASLLGT